MNIKDSDIKGGFFACYKLLSNIKHDMLNEMWQQGLVFLLINELDVEPNPYSQFTILQTLINLALDDQIAIQTKDAGPEVIGKKLLFTEEQDFTKYCEGEEQQEIKLKIELMALVVLRFLYSVEKNRKHFKLVFPPEVFGPFIDVGNYVNVCEDWDKHVLYEPTLQKLSLMEHDEWEAILTNLAKMRKEGEEGADRDTIINGYKVMDIAGKGAFGQVYTASKISE